MAKIKNKIKIAKGHIFAATRTCMSTGKGSILAYTFIILAMMVAIVATMSVATVVEKKGASSTDFSVQAFQTADSGVQLAMKKMNANLTGTIMDAFGSCSEVGGAAQVIGNDAGLANSPYTLTFFSDEDGTVSIASCYAQVSSIQNIKSVGKFRDTIRAVSVAVAAGFKCVEKIIPANTMSSCDQLCAADNMLCVHAEWYPRNDTYTCFFSVTPNDNQFTCACCPM